jgi:hypothetical protein
LNEIGFDWDPYDASWETMFAELQRYKERYGDCKVPREWKPNVKLARWVNTQRSLEKESGISADRKRRLDELGFEWALHTSVWEMRFSELENYREKVGDCNVPIRWEENPQLGGWVAKQRQQQREGTLSAERKGRLDALGFEWSRRQTTKKVDAEPRKLESKQ